MCKLLKRTINGNKTARITLKENRFTFKEDPQKPNFQMNRIAQVEKVKMNIALNGTFTNPKLNISSDPPINKNKLLLALATNTTWKNTENSLNQKTISADMSKEFVDYFFGGKQGNRLAEKLGFKNIPIQFNSQNKGIAVSKNISNRLEGRYAIEGKKKIEGPPDVSQKIGGGYQVTDSLAVEAKKEIKKDVQTPAPETNKASAEELLFKFKTTF